MSLHWPAQLSPCRNFSKISCISATHFIVCLSGPHLILLNFVRPCFDVLQFKTRLEKVPSLLSLQCRSHLVNVHRRHTSLPENTSILSFSFCYCSVLIKRVVAGWGREGGGGYKNLIQWDQSQWLMQRERENKSYTQPAESLSCEGCLHHRWPNCHHLSLLFTIVILVFFFSDKIMMFMILRVITLMIKSWLWWQWSFNNGSRNPPRWLKCFAVFQRLQKIFKTVNFELETNVFKMGNPSQIGPISKCQKVYKLFC